MEVLWSMFDPNWVCDKRGKCIAKQQRFKKGFIPKLYNLIGIKKVLNKIQKSNPEIYFQTYNFSNL